MKSIVLRNTYFKNIYLILRSAFSVPAFSLAECSSCSTWFDFLEDFQDVNVSIHSRQHTQLMNYHVNRKFLTLQQFEMFPSKIKVIKIFLNNDCHLRKSLSYNQVYLIISAGLRKHPYLYFILSYFILKWCYDESRILPIEAILKHKQVVCKRRKMRFTFFETAFSFRSRDVQVFKICKLAK